MKPSKLETKKPRSCILNSTERNNLKKCPFCLGQAELISGKELDGSFVLCKSCEAKSGYTESVNEAVDKWNTRHEPKREFVVNPATQP